MNTSTNLTNNSIYIEKIHTFVHFEFNIYQLMMKHPLRKSEQAMIKTFNTPEHD